MVSSATAFNNWKAKLALFSVFIRSYADGSHLDPVSTCLTREKKKEMRAVRWETVALLYIFNAVFHVFLKYRILIIVYI